MATLVSRGLDSAGAIEGPPAAVLSRVKTANDESNQDYEDFSTKVMAVAKTRDATSKQLAASDLVESATLADADAWVVLEWDPQVELVVIQADAAIDISTDKGSTVAGAAYTLAADTAFPLHVAGSPNGRIYVKRNEATGQPVIKAYGYGSRKMAFSTFNVFDTASLQTA